MPAARHVSLVAQRIHEIRQAKKLSREEFGKKIGESRLQIFRLETGITEVSAEAAAKCAEALDVSVLSLYRKKRRSS